MTKSVSEPMAKGRSVRSRQGRGNTKRSRLERSMSRGVSRSRCRSRSKLIVDWNRSGRSVFIIDWSLIPIPLLESIAVSCVSITINVTVTITLQVASLVVVGWGRCVRLRVVDRWLVLCRVMSVYGFVVDVVCCGNDFVVVVVVVVDLVVVGGPEAVHVDRRLAVLRKMFRKYFFYLFDKNLEFILFSNYHTSVENNHVDIFL
jgi:hypothetical protein